MRLTVLHRPYAASQVRVPRRARCPEVRPFLGHRILLKNTGLEPPGYLSHYMATSGLSANTAVAQELKHLFAVLWMVVCFDRLDALNLSAAEYVARRILMIQRAVKRNPRSPDFDGLESFLANTLDSQGGIVTLEFEKYMAGIQQAEAQVMKQQRMAREEVEALDKKRKSGKKGDKGGGKDADPSA